MEIDACYRSGTVLFDRTFFKYHPLKDQIKNCPDASSHIPALQ